MVATEKVSSPSKIRNKNIKTMSQLMKATPSLSAMKAIIEPQQIQQQQQQQSRLCKLPIQIQNEPRQPYQAPQVQATEQSLTRNAMVCKTMSSVILDDRNNHVHTATIASQSEVVMLAGQNLDLTQTNSCTMPAIKDREEMEENENQLNKSNFLAKRVSNSEHTSTVKSDSCPTHMKKKNRNNSTSDVSRKLFQPSMPKQQPASGNVTCYPVKQKNNSKGKLTVRSSDTGQQTQTKGAASAYTKTGKALSSNFTSTANIAMNSKKHANFELAQNLVLHQDVNTKKQASFCQNEKVTTPSTTCPSSTKYFQFLQKREQSAEGPAVTQASTQVASKKMQPKNGRAETANSKEQIQLSKNLCITAVHQPNQIKHSPTKQILDKRTTSTVEIPLLSLNTIQPNLMNKSLSSTARNQQAHLVISRNPKQVYSSQIRPIQVMQNESQSINRLQISTSSVTLNAPLLTARSHGFCGVKKEIKCVVTKQTKFGEERQQQQIMQQQNNQQTSYIKRASPPQATSNELSYDLQSKKTVAIKKLDMQCSKTMSKTASLAAVPKSLKNFSTANTSLNSKTMRPSQPIVLPSGQSKFVAKNRKKDIDMSAVKKGYATARTNTIKAASSADKNKEKLKRRQIAEKIKSQLSLIPTYEPNRDVDRMRQEIKNSKTKPSINESGQAAMQKTFDAKLSSPVLKIPPKYFIKTPTKDLNPLRPQQKTNRLNFVSKLSTDGAHLSSQSKKLKSERKKTKPQHDTTQVFEVPKFDSDQQLNQIKSAVQPVSKTAYTKFESPKARDNSRNESQLSAPQEMGSRSGSADLDLREKTSKSISKGVMVPKSVAKSTKQKTQLKKPNKKQPLLGYQTRNYEKSEIILSQRLQRTLPNLVAPHDTLLPKSVESQHGDEQESATFCRNAISPRSMHKHRLKSGTTKAAELSEGLALIKDIKLSLQAKRPTYVPGMIGSRQRNRNDTLFYSERRNTVYSDSLSLELVRQSKPSFMKPEKKKGSRLNEQNIRAAQSDSKHDLSNSSFSQKMNKLGQDEGQDPDSSDQQLETIELGKHIPPASLQEGIKFKNRMLSGKSIKPRDRYMPIETDSKFDTSNYGPGSVEPKIKQVEATENQISQDYDTDWKILYQSPAKSICDEVFAQSDVANYLIDDCGTNDAFSDSQFGEIADEEENYNEKQNLKVRVRERDLNSFNHQNDEKVDVIVAPSYGPTANLSGKYTSCTNKNDALSKFECTQKRLPTIRQAAKTSQVECSNFNAVETVKQILSKKGSKCKCDNSENNQEHEIYTGVSRKVCGNFCKHLSGRQQKKIVKKLLLENFKMVIENVLKSNQCLTLGQKQNPFMLGANFGCLGDRKFLISASWWSKWCDFVNFNIDEHGLTFPKESFRDELLCDTEENDDFMDLNKEYVGIEVVNIELEDQQNQVDRILRQSIYQQSSFATLAEAIDNYNEQSQLFYERPETIENSNLIEKDETSYRNKVDKTLVEHFDYEVVPHSVWQHLYSWYSADITIGRTLAIDTIANKSSSSQQLVQVIGNDQALPMHAQDYQRNQKFKVFLDLWPSQNQTMFNKVGFSIHQSAFNAESVQQKSLFAGLAYEDFDEQDEPATSNDTTQLLYKQLIEDQSSATNQTTLLASTPEVTDQQMRQTPTYQAQVLQNQGNSFFESKEESIAFSLFNGTKLSNMLRSHQDYQLDSGALKTQLGRKQC